jgi:hypothetical protein
VRWSQINWPAVGYVSLEDLEGYREHLVRLVEDASPPVAALATVRWTDARIESWRVDDIPDPEDEETDTVEVDLPAHGTPSPSIVRATVIVKNDEVLDTADGLWRRWNHARVTLRFDGAVLEPDDTDALALLAGDARINRGELEHVGPDGWELRLLVSPTGELAIRFHDVQVAVRRVAESAYTALEARPAHGWHGPVPDGWVAYASPLVRAAADGDLGGLHLTEDETDVDELDPRWGFAPLHAAAWFDRAALIAPLVERGATVDQPDLEGRTALVLAIDRDARRAVDELLAHGADPEGRDSDGNTAVLRAAWGGRAAIVRALADAGADIRVTGSRGATLLIAAADSDDPETVRVAQGLGIDPDARDDEGSTAHDRAALHRESRTEALLAGPTGD